MPPSVWQINEPKGNGINESLVRLACVYAVVFWVVFVGLCGCLPYYLCIVNFNAAQAQGCSITREILVISAFILHPAAFHIHFQKRKEKKDKKIKKKAD